MYQSCDMHLGEKAHFGWVHICGGLYLICNSQKSCSTLNDNLTSRQMCAINKIWFWKNNVVNVVKNSISKVPFSLLLFHDYWITFYNFALWRPNFTPGVDTGCFQHWYTNFGHTNIGMPKFNVKVNSKLQKNTTPDFWSY